MKIKKGKILVTILIIVLIILAVKLKIYVDKSKQIICDGTEKEEFSIKDKYNSVVKKYSKENLSGLQVKELIKDIVNQNDYYINESGKFISIHAKNITGYNNSNELDKACKKANVYENLEYGENNEYNINTAKEKILELYYKIENSKRYKILEGYSYGWIYAITIEELKN